MCVVSAMGDFYSDQWRPYVSQPTPTILPFASQDDINAIKRDLAELKKQVEEMKKILLVAKKYDEDHGEPACEMDEKVEILKKVAELVGVDLSEVFGD